MLVRKDWKRLVFQRLGNPHTALWSGATHVFRRGHVECGFSRLGTLEMRIYSAPADLRIVGTPAV